MKKLTILIFSVLLTTVINAQEQAIKIVNQTSKKEVFIKNNKRIKLKTITGEKISGRFTIENNSILIKDQHISLADIAEIKRNPLLVSILTSSFLIYGGVATLGLGVVIGGLINTNAFWLIVPGAVMIYTGIKSPSFTKKFKTDKNWTFKIITIPELQTATAKNRSKNKPFVR